MDSKILLYTISMSNQDLKVSMLEANSKTQLQYTENRTLVYSQKSLLYLNWYNSKHISYSYVIKFRKMKYLYFFESLWVAYGWN